MNVESQLKKMVVCVAGLGYVGQPLAEALSRLFKVVVYDMDKAKVKKLTDDKNYRNLELTSDPTKFKTSDFMAKTKIYYWSY